MDAFAVSVSSGISIQNVRVRDALLIAAAFGFFQCMMPIAGWALGFSVQSLVSMWDHWIAFGLLALIGGKMIYESFQLDTDSKPSDPRKLGVLLLLAIATSIDALATGLSFAFLNVTIITPSIIIGCVTFLISLVGVLIGKKIGHFFEKKIEIIGGLILIGIGLKILVQHLFFQ